MDHESIINSNRNATAASAANSTAVGTGQGVAPKSYALSGKIMLTAISSLLAVVVLVLCLHIYSRWYYLRLARRRRLARAFARRSAAAGSSDGGLDPDLVKSLPVFTYSPQQGKDGTSPPPPPPPECPVCLCEFEERDQGRILPACGHVFHAECIAMWFHSHSTCPLCRAQVDERAVRKPDVPAVAAPCRCVEEGRREAGSTPAVCSSSSASSSGSGSPASTSDASIIMRCLPDLDLRTSCRRAGGGDLSVDLERGESATETTSQYAANRTASKTRSPL